MLGEYDRRAPARFHMPGHKGQDTHFGGELAGWDITELEGTDDLAAPADAIRAAEQAYAEAYGARDSLLLVNGSTCGLQTMLLALGQNKRVLLGRDCHKSALCALALAGHSAQFLTPAYDAEHGMPGMLTARQVHDALSERRADAVLITSPNYFGLCADLDEIADAAHAHGALLFVDAAHGAHFPFSPRLPDFPSHKVDIWCTSSHKTLAALTQGAVLHAGLCCPYPTQHLRRMRNLVQTSSPSYLLMASLDRALHIARMQGYEKHIDRVEVLRARIGRINGLQVLGEEALGNGIAAFDPTRIVIDVTERGIDGHAANSALTDMGVVCEMADMYRVALITAPLDPDEWYDRLVGALTHLPYGTSRLIKRPPVGLAGRSMCSLRKAMLGESESVPLHAAAGRVAAAAAGVYPPGIAQVIPGEYIEEDTAAFLLRQKALGYTLFGIEGDRICCMREE
jgi:arginine/lysine/ornithine decarboxylase